MRTEYISLTNAIGLFEEYKINYIAKNMTSRYIDFTETQKLSNSFDENNRLIWDLSEDDILKSQDFLFCLGRSINLYGKLSKNNELETIPERITIHLYDKKYHRIYNNYDYIDIYNESHNYDTLHDITTGEYIYFCLSIKRNELIDLIKTIFSN